MVFFGLCHTLCWIWGIFVGVDLTRCNNIGGYKRLETAHPASAAHLNKVFVNIIQTLHS